jgi:hypothetical protein
MDAITASLLWRAALVTALIDAPIVALLARFVPRQRFARLRWFLAGAAFGVFALIWYAFGSVMYWEAVYRAVFPAGWRWLLPLIFGTLEGALALLFWRVGMAAKHAPVAWCIALGGLASVAGHSIGAARGLFRVPMLADASIPAALTFGVFEFVFYWSVIVALAAVSHQLSTKSASPQRTRSATKEEL